MSPAGSGKHPLLFPVLWRFLSYFIISVSAVVALFLYLGYQRFQSELEGSKTQEILRLKLASNSLVHDFKHIVSDIHMLSESQHLSDFLTTPSARKRRRLELFFLSLAQHRKQYDQIRFIDNRGRETVRVNNVNGKAVIVAQDQLQNKSARYYFRESHRSGINEVFISPMDLNVENGSIEKPYKPMLRVALPVFDQPGSRRGLLVINYLADSIRFRFKQIMTGSWGFPMLVNADGYWLYSSNSRQEWGFQLDHGHSFASHHDDAWRSIKKSVSGRIQTQRGIFIFHTWLPMSAVMESSGDRLRFSRNDASMRFWKLISFVPLQSAVFKPAAYIGKHRITVAAVLSILGMLSLVIANLRTRNIIHARRLRDSDHQVRLLLDAVAEGIFGLDQKGRCTFVNPTALQLLGYEQASALVGQPIHSMIHHTRPDGSACNEQQCKIHGMLNNGKSVHVDDDIMWRADGTSFPVEYHTTPLIENGEIRGSVTAFIEISQRKQAEEALQLAHDQLEQHVRERTAELVTANRRLQDEIAEREQTRQTLTQERNFVSAVLGTISALVIVLDPQGHIVRFNRACEQVTGYRFEELQGKPFWDYLLLPEEIEAVKKVFQSLAKTGMLSHYENYWTTKDGGRRLISWSNTALRNESSGEIDYVIGTGIDVTEHREAELALRSSEQQMRLITDNLPVLIAYLDAKQCYRFNNRSYEEWFGVAREQIYGKHVREVVGEQAYLKIKDKLDQVLAGSEVSFETVVPYKGAGDRYVNATYLPDFDDQATVRGFFVLIRDITEQKQAEAKIREHQAELAHLGRLSIMGEMATGLAHELNQPLSAIHTYAEIAMVQPEVENTALLPEALQGIRDQAKRASEIIHRLREHVRKREVQRTGVDLNDLIRDVLAFVQPELERQAIDVDVDMHPLPFIYADRIQIEQVLLNLINNAVHAMAGSEKQIRKLTIHSRVVDGKAEVLIRDTGPGMDEQTLKEIFKPFVSTKGAEGLGMGLSISRSIAEAHQGRLWVASTPGQGADFHLTLPIQQPEN